MQTITYPSTDHHPARRRRAALRFAAAYVTGLASLAACGAGVALALQLLYAIPWVLAQCFSTTGKPGLAELWLWNAESMGFAGGVILSGVVCLFVAALPILWLAFTAPCITALGGWTLAHFGRSRGRSQATRQAPSALATPSLDKPDREETWERRVARQRAQRRAPARPNQE